MQGPKQVYPETVKYWLDPPSGWMYGFPKLWNPNTDPDIETWLLKNGYPESQVEFGLTYLRQWEDK